MSYYSSKHPGLYLYLALVTATLCAFLFMDISSAQIGILSILWGVFTGLRALSLYEIDTYHNTYTRQSTLISKEHNGQSSALAHDLMRRMTGNANIRQGIHALYCMHERTLLWFALALGYTTYYLHINSESLSQGTLMEKICILFMIGTAFWGGQSYAHSNKAFKIMVSFFAAALCVSLFYTPIENISLAHISQAISEASLAKIRTAGALLALLALYSISILIYALLQKNKAAISALCGISLISLLAICYLSLEQSQTATALWISGWGLFSVFWTRAYRPVRKRYVLYQCD